MRKIAHIITGLDSGGAEHMLLQILPSLQNSDLHHIVYCLRKKGVIGGELEKKNIQVVYLDYQKHIDLIRTVFRLKESLKKNKPDIIVTYLIHADLIGRVVGRLCGVKKIICYKHGGLASWEWLKVFDRLTKSLVSIYLSVSEAVRNKYLNDLKLKNEKIIVLRNGIDIDKFRQKDITASKKRLQKEFNLAEDDYVLGVVANLLLGKGHLDLVSAFSQVSKQITEQNLKLLIVGSGPEEENIKQAVHNHQLQESVIFAGYRKDIPDIDNLIDLFVLPTFAEGMSVAILEAMVAKKPIITTNIPENTEILRHNHTALLIKAGQVEELTQAIITLIKNQEMAKTLGNNAYQYCYNNYNLKRTITEFRDILLSL